MTAARRCAQLRPDERTAVIALTHDPKLDELALMDALKAITRERLRDGTLLAAIRANPPPGLNIRSDAELEASLDRTLQQHDAGADVYVFGYGSLMWNPTVEHTQALKAYVHGWRRRFCLRLLLGRGSPQQPGLMLALDRGGSCYGVAFRIPAEHARDELRLLWRREMFSGAYEARWVTALVEGKALRALTFVASRAHVRYTHKLPIDQVARMISTGRGSLGSCRAYFEATLQKLEAMGVKDAGMECIRLALIAAEDPVATAESVG